MHGYKPLRRLGGRTLLARAIDHALESGLHSVLSLRSRDQIPDAPDLPIVLDRPDLKGPLAGVAAGLDWARDRGLDAILTIPVDMPWLPQDLASRLAGESQRRAVVASSGGRRHPVCALWPVASLPALETYVAKGDRSLHGLLEVMEARQVDWPVANHDPFANLNDPTELAEAEELLQKSM